MAKITVKMTANRVYPTNGYFTALTSDGGRIRQSIRLKGPDFHQLRAAGLTDGSSFVADLELTEGGKLVAISTDSSAITVPGLSNAREMRGFELAGEADMDIEYGAGEPTIAHNSAPAADSEVPF
jgi:hypothetical protein